jgi:magnesium-dependent phosphatase 1
MASPGLVVFDLDFTLWDCGGLWIDCTEPPFRLLDGGEIVDRRDRPFRLFADVVDILDELDGEGVPMAVASRTEQPSWAREILELMGIRERFAFEEIYPGSKITHFRELSRTSGSAYREMLFFDDEHRNIREVGGLGVRSIEVRNGLTRDSFEEGMAWFPSR